MRPLLDQSACALITKTGVTSLIGPGTNVYFGDEDPQALANALDKASNEVWLYYESPARKRYLTDAQLALLSVRIAAYHLQLYRLWRLHYEKHKKLPLELQPGDVDGIQSRRACYALCRERLGNNFRVAAASLMKMTLSELEEFEDAEKRYADR